ncbi:MAG TPA: LLM class flavin-dependent oxidoreductase, partial [Pseudomonadales bacterium]|nr:LLM class flavin-dependent oxidoreductase [Pseudomonadales bacterium]
MRLGALLSPPDGTDSGSIHAQARTFEAEGYSSIWSAHAMGRGFMLADPLIALTIAAAVTTQVELGTGILQLPLYNPTDIALKSWTLALVSGGRFVLGVGAGSTEADYRVHRQSFTNRFRQFDTALASLQETFRTGEVDGVSLAPWQGVAPPKILFGTWGRRVERAARAFDGWLASGMHRSVEECAGAL